MKKFAAFFSLMLLSSGHIHATTDEEDAAEMRMVYTQSIGVLGEVLKSKELNDLLVEKRALWRSIQPCTNFLIPLEPGEEPSPCFAIKVEGTRLPEKSCIATYIMVDYKVNSKELKIGEDSFKQCVLPKE